VLAWTSVATAGAAAATEGPSDEVLRLALRAYHCGRDRGYFPNPYLTVVDHSLPSSQPRLWVIDVRSGDVVLKELVAHGRNSGVDRVSSHSNEPGSKQSSLGLFRTDETYVGRHGYSLRLSGLERGWNDHARDRAIVIHGADYVSAAFLGAHGRLGRSWGCPAVRPAVSRSLIDRIKDGGAVFIYYPDDEWLRTSSYLNCDGRLASR